METCEQNNTCAEIQSCLDRVLHSLREARAVHLWGYRIDSLQQYICRRVEDLELESYPAYADYLLWNNAECDALLNAILISSSSFYREGLTFAILAEIILPRLMAASPDPPNNLRIWSAGCSAGEELYSLAMLLREYEHPFGKDVQYFLLGTDINQVVLDQAVQGSYSRESLRNLPLHFVESCFEQRQQVYALSQDIRSMACFCKDDLLDNEHIAPAESIFGSFDLIICRNVLDVL